MQEQIEVEKNGVQELFLKSVEKQDFSEVMEQEYGSRVQATCFKIINAVNPALRAQYPCDSKIAVRSFLMDLQELLRAKPSEAKRIAFVLEDKKVIDFAVSELNQMLYLGEEEIKSVLYAMLSLYSPNISVNGLKKRKASHLLMVGDVGSAKTTINHLVRILAPKSIYASDWSKPTFVGIATREGIEEGVIDSVQDAVLIISEFGEVKIPYEKQFLDGDVITVFKGGNTKSIEPNTVLFASLNPENAFFQSQVGVLRGQIPKGEAELSRFDYIIPLMNSRQKNEDIIDRMDFFSGQTPADLMKLREQIQLLVTGMKQVKQVLLTPEQKQELKQAFKQQNKQLSGTRPLLLIPRDIEVLLRFCNTIACINGAGQQIVQATDEDVQEAVSVWDKIIDWRHALYTQENRQLPSLQDKVLAFFPLETIIRTKDLEKRVCGLNEGKQDKDRNGNPLGVCSRATLYRYLNKLEKEGKVEKASEGWKRV
jgi:DNA replicative helicase MCM subunit Mcm2 (Cdc46/Mcm family)